MENHECEQVDEENKGDKSNEDVYVGREVDNLEEALALYKAHAYRMGFSVRKGMQAFFAGTKNLRMKRFCCSKQGYKNNEQHAETSNIKPDSRTRCTAMVQFTVGANGLWRITQFIKEHNHEFVKPEHRHLMRSMRNISEAKGNLIKSMVNAGISTNQVYNYLSEEARGFDKVGGISKDVYNFVNNERLRLIESGDGQSLVHHLQRRQAEDPQFYYNFQFDEQLRLTNVFWRDGRSRLDYDCFGDVVVFDTTYRTNKYDLVCAPFVGVNNHWQTIIFGCAFLLRETSESFIWLFEKFLESMERKAPKTIMTNQDSAMAIAIERVMPNTCHRLCLWHISKNAPSHFGCLNSQRGFISMWYKCMNGCDSEEEFDQTWKKMINDYNLHDHSWLKKMYNLRFKWSTAFSKDVFSAGIKSSQRSESTNNVLGDIGNKTTSLTEFFLSFEKLLGRWRQSESEEDYKCSQAVPTHIVETSEVLHQATRIYTHKMYKVFEKEYLNILGGSHKEIKIDGDVILFQVEEGRNLLMVVLNQLRINP